jgi:hypothetical protein
MIGPREGLMFLTPLALEHWPPTRSLRVTSAHGMKRVVGAVSHP